MRVLVLLKQVPDIVSDRRLDADGLIERNAADAVLNEIDEAALEIALRAATTLGGDVTALTMGPSGAVAVVRRALQVGARSAVHVCDDALVGSDAPATARALAAAVRVLEREDGELALVVAGAMALDGLGGVVPGLLAAELGRAVVSGAHSLDVQAAPGQVVATRECDDGEEVLRAALPAVVSVTDTIATLRAPSFATMLAARTAPVRTLSVSDLALAPSQVGQAGSRVRVTSAAPRPTRPEPEVVVASDAEVGARRVVDFLLARGLVGGGHEQVDIVTDPDLGCGVDAEGGAPQASGSVLLVTRGEPGVDLVRLSSAAGTVHHLRLGEAPLPPSEPLAATIAASAHAVGARAVVLPATRGAAEVGALLAHRLGGALVWDVRALRRAEDGGALLASKRVLGGTWDVEGTLEEPALVLADPGPSEGSARIVPVPVPDVAGEDGTRVERVSLAAGARDAVPLAGAGVVVAGGRGLEGDLAPVRVLAHALGGAVGATRDIVEEGWIGPEAMVGQTGTIVAPRLYIGAGLSGAPHHMLGMRASGTIVAVNTDPDAPIMEAADLAVVGDAAAVLTATARLLRERGTE